MWRVVLIVALGLFLSSCSAVEDGLKACGTVLMGVCGPVIPLFAIADATMNQVIGGAGHRFAGEESNGGQSFEYYGNWCGPNFPAKGTNPLPVDELDQLCKRHDKCYQELGFRSCACDGYFISGLDELLDSDDEYRYSVKEVQAISMYRYFYWTKCLDGSKWKISRKVLRRYKGQKSPYF